MATVALVSPTLCCYYSYSHRHIFHSTTSKASRTTILTAICADVRSAGASQIAASSRKLGTAFATGSPLLVQRPIHKRSTASNSKSFLVRCEQSAEEGCGVDVWLGRLAMVGFATAISVEIGTGKGLLENFGLTSPLPTVALAVTALVGVLTAVFIFQSASKN